MKSFRFKSLRNDTPLGSPAKEQESQLSNNLSKVTSETPKKGEADLMRDRIEKLALAVKRCDDETGRDVASDTVIVENLTQLLKIVQKGVTNNFAGDVAALHGLPLILLKISEKIDLEAAFIPNNPVLKVMSAIVWLIGNTTNASKLFARQVELEADGILSWMLTISSSKRVRENLQDRAWYDVVNGCLTSFLNIAKLPETREIFIKIRAVDALSFYLQSSSDDLKCTVMIFTAHIVGDSDSGRLADNFGVIASMTNFLQTAMKTYWRNCCGFSVEELAEGVSLLMVNDANKSKFVSEGILPLLDDLLDSQSRLEQSRAVDCVWALAFSKKERKRMLKDTNVVKKLKSLAKSSEDRDLQLKASNALTYVHKNLFSKAKEAVSRKFRENQESEEEPAETDANEEIRKEGGYLFLSYCHKQQKEVFRLREAFKCAGYEVWIDVEKLHGSTLQAMAEAIEKSSGAIICFSEDYSKSNACRAEGEYIYQLQKPFVPVKMVYGFKADGWLGIILGSQFYVDFASPKTTFDQACSKLFEQIGAKIPELTQPLNNNINKAKPNKDEVIGENSNQQAFTSWTREDVRRWLNRENLQQFASHFEKLDGRMLSVLHEMKMKAPESYYTMVSRQFDNSSMTDSLRLLDALDRLWLPSAIANVKPF